MQSEKREIDCQCCGKRLKNGYDHCLLADFFEIFDAKLVSHRKSDKPERRVGYYREFRDVFRRRKAKSLDTEKSETVRAYKNTCNEVRRNGRKVPYFS